MLYLNGKVMTLTPKFIFTRYPEGYKDGQESVFGSSGYLAAEASGEEIRLEDISRAEHILAVKLTAEAETDFTAVTLTDINGNVYTPNAAGEVEDVKSTYPVTELKTYTDGVIINCGYYKDIDGVLEKYVSETDEALSKLVSLEG